MHRQIPNILDTTRPDPHSTPTQLRRDRATQCRAWHGANSDTVKPRGTRPSNSTGDAKSLQLHVLILVWRREGRQSAYIQRCECPSDGTQDMDRLKRARPVVQRCNYSYSVLDTTKPKKIFPRTCSSAHCPRRRSYLPPRPRATAQQAPRQRQRQPRAQHRRHPARSSSSSHRHRSHFPRRGPPP